MSERSISFTKPPLSLDNADLIAAVCTALSDPVRLRLFDLIKRAGKKGMCSCDMTEPLERSQPTISHHVKILREAGLLESRREGTWSWYSVTPSALHMLARFIQ